MGKLKKFWNAVDEEMKERRKPFILLGNILRVNKNQITVTQADILSREREFISIVAKDTLIGHDFPLSLQKDLTKMLLKDWYTKMSLREKFYVDGVASGKITISEIPMKVVRGMCDHTICVSYDMLKKCQELTLDKIPPYDLAERYKAYMEKEKKKAEERRAQIRKEIEAESEANLAADDDDDTPKHHLTRAQFRKNSDDAVSDELPDKLDMDENGHIVGMSLEEIEERCKEAELPDKLDDLVSDELPDKLEYKEI